MTDKTKRRLYYVFTFGIGYLIAKKKAKKIAQSVNTEIKVNTDVKIDVDSLINELGGINNISNVSSTLSCLIIELNDKSVIDLNDLKTKFDSKGVYLTSNKLNIIFGDFSIHLMELIKQKLPTENN